MYIVFTWLNTTATVRHALKFDVATTLGRLLLVLTNVSDFVNTCMYLAQLNVSNSSTKAFLYKTYTSVTLYI